MKVLLSALLLVSPAAALGADLASKAPAPALRGPSFEDAGGSPTTGVYLGLSAGSGFGSIGRTTQEMLAQAGITLDTSKARLVGPLGGVQAGFAMQSGSIVYGFEGDLNSAGVRGALNASGTVNVGGTTPATYVARDRIESRLFALGTLRARIGYAFGDTIIYGTGGYAAARYEMTETGQAFQAQSTTPFLTNVTQVKQWANGWTMGFGGEYAVSRNVGLKLEYLHAQLDKKIYGEPWGHSLNIMRSGVNYHF